jgi:hypothetical protein
MTGPITNGDVAMLGSMTAFGIMLLSEPGSFMLMFGLALSITMLLFCLAHFAGLIP